MRENGDREQPRDDQFLTIFFVPWREALGGANAAEEFQLLRVWNGVGLDGVRKHFNRGLRLQCLLVDMDGYGALSW